MSTNNSQNSTKFSNQNSENNNINNNLSAFEIISKLENKYYSNSEGPNFEIIKNYQTDNKNYDETFYNNNFIDYNRYLFIHKYNQKEKKPQKNINTQNINTNFTNSNLNPISTTEIEEKTNKKNKSKKKKPNKKFFRYFFIHQKKIKKYQKFIVYFINQKRKIKTTFKLYEQKKNRFRKNYEIKISLKNQIFSKKTSKIFLKNDFRTKFKINSRKKNKIKLKYLINYENFLYQFLIENFNFENLFKKITEYFYKIYLYDNYKNFFHVENIKRKKIKLLSLILYFTKKYKRIY